METKTGSNLASNSILLTNARQKEIATMLHNKGYEPVWKDFDATLVKEVNIA